MYQAASLSLVEVAAQGTLVCSVFLRSSLSSLSSRSNCSFSLFIVLTSLPSCMSASAASPACGHVSVGSFLRTGKERHLYDWHLALCKAELLFIRLPGSSGGGHVLHPIPPRKLPWSTTALLHDGWTKGTLSGALPFGLPTRVVRSVWVLAKAFTLEDNTSFQLFLHSLSLLDFPFTFSSCLFVLPIHVRPHWKRTLLSHFWRTCSWVQREFLLVFVQPRILKTC